jgi:glycosyltransferase involved in cell wall biosynthesis
LSRQPVIRFDAYMAYHSGIGTHIRGLLEAILKWGPPGELIVHAPSTLKVEHPATQTEKFPGRLYGLRRKLYLPVPQPTDLIHFPHWNCPRFIPGRPRKIVSIHDLTHLRIPQVGGSFLRRAYIRNWIASAAQSADMILTGSHHTKQDLLKEFPIPYDKIRVIGNGLPPKWVPLSVAESTQFLEQMGIAPPYLLLVGNGKPHKNLRWAVEQLTRILDQKQLPHGIIATAALPVASLRYRCTGPVGHDQLKALYQNAEALVMPSLYEGFGLPVIEAQSLGTPVLCSTAASLPEVSGGSQCAAMFDPQSPAELENALERILDPGTRESLRQQGQKNAARYSWDMVAQDVLSVWRSLL